MMNRIISTILLFALIFAFPAQAQEHVDQSVIARIKEEGFQRSQVMDTMFYLTDVHGPRLRGSPNYMAAAEWAVKTLAAWGLSNAQLEPGGVTGRGWTVNRFNLEMIAAQYQGMIAMPFAWSPSTKGVVAGQPLIVEISSPADLAKYRGKLRGAIVMLGRPSEKPAAHFEPDAKRLTDDELKRGEQALNPADKIITAYEGPNYAQSEKARREGLERRATISKFFVD